MASELKTQLNAARAAGSSVRGLVVINPGNPTGQTLSEDNMKEVVQLCVDVRETLPSLLALCVSMSAFPPYTHIKLPVFH